MIENVAGCFCTPELRLRSLQSRQHRALRLRHRAAHAKKVAAAFCTGMLPAVQCQWCDFGTPSFHAGLAEYHIPKARCACKHAMGESVGGRACSSTTRPAQLIRHSYCGKQVMHLE